jgi:divalent metal cation (Fe/Co/Zn/Cd) transporter
VAIESVRNLLTRETPETTLLGIGLTVSSLLLMPALGVAKRRLGYRLSSGATAGEGFQNLLCAYLAGAVLVGLLGNSLWGWWWLDPVAGLLVAVVAIKEGREACSGESWCATPAAATTCTCALGCTNVCCNAAAHGGGQPSSTRDAIP